MLKITKGLKKKKKGRKGKRKEEELFEEAELEQYRKEQEQKRLQKEAGEGTAEEGEEKQEAKGEEWEKFKALTSGVDSILKKTQGDLDRIKKESYFQRKPTPSEVAAEKEQGEKGQDKDKKWIGFEEGAAANRGEEEGAVGQEDNPEVVVTEEELAFKPEEEEEEEEDDEEEDIFDTSYVDVVASGEVKLAYIPDSPTQEEEEFDPFDTSIVDKVIKEEPADKKKRNLVSLGCAVDVLTGKVEKPTVASEVIQKRSPRRQRPRDLLLGSFDEGGGEQETEPPQVQEPVKTLLDDDPLIGEDIELDLSINLAPIARSTTATPIPEVLEETEVGSDNIKSIVSEFDVITAEEPVKENLTNGKLEEYDELDDEFAELAAESLVKEVTKVSPLLESEEKSLKPTRPPPPKSTANEDLDLDENYEGDDPFDTSFAAQILPGKYELKLIEEEVLKETEPVVKAPSINLPKTGGTLRDPLAFDEHNLLDADDQTEPLSFKHRDLLGGSTTDLSKISHNPIEPAPVSETIERTAELSYCDPFDTSVVNDLVAPGKAELKFLEKELLAEGTHQSVDVDNDFDPRADTPPRKKSVPRPDQLFIGDKRQSIPKVVAFKVSSPEQPQDLLTAADSDNHKASKPLTPYYPEPKLLENNTASCENETDPFDTSFVSSIPGKLELKLIENELVGSEPVAQIPQVAQVQQQVPQILKHSVSDPDFDPRALDQPETSAVAQDPQVPDILQDILSEDVTVDTKLHTPVVPKRIEEELQNYDNYDPFDTSIAQHILPGKAELKLLENELINSAEEIATTLKRSYTDPDFDPRLTEDSEPQVQEEVKEESRPANLDLTEHPIIDQVTEKPLTPLSATFSANQEDIDPFDTSCVGDLIPGKVELKLIETELIHN